MAGVEILNTTYEYASLIDTYWLLLCLVSLITVGIIGIITVDYDIIQKIIFPCVIFLTLVTVVCMIGVAIETDEIINTKHEIIISDEVSMNEFNEKYEIIEQRGKIYTVKERD